MRLYASQICKILIFSILLLLTNGCGKIIVDGYSINTETTSFGDVKAQLYGTKSGILFIHRKAPYELLLSFSFKLNDLKRATLKTIELINPNSNESLFIRKNIDLNIVPQKGDSRIYFNESNVLSVYEKVKLHLSIELETNSGSQIHEIIFLFNKKPTSRWWTFFELV